METGKLTRGGDSDAYLGQAEAKSLPSPSPCARWERPLSNDSNHAPAHPRPLTSADRRLSDSHPEHRLLRQGLSPSSSAGRALRLPRLRALAVDPLDDRCITLDRPPPALDSTDLLIEGTHLGELPKPGPVRVRTYLPPHTYQDVEMAIPSMSRSVVSSG